MMNWVAHSMGFGLSSGAASDSFSKSPSTLGEISGWAARYLQREVLEILQPSFPPLESRLAAFLSKAPCAVGWRDSPARSLDAEVVARRRVARGKSHDKLSRMR